MDDRIEIKVEPDDEVEPCDGTYACLFHRACHEHSKCAEVCPTCGRKTVEVWKVAGGGNAAPSAIIDLTGAGERAAEVATLTERGARGDAVPAVSGTVATANGVGQGARGGRADAESGGSSKGTARSLRKQRPARGLRPIVRRQVGELG